MKKIGFGNKGKSGEKGGRKGKKILIILVILLILLLGLYAAIRIKAAKASSANAKGVRTATVERQDITSKLSSSGTVSAKNTYEITSLVEGEVAAADFEEGDQVEKGQVLYQIDASSTESELTNAKNSLTRAQENYQASQDDYNEALRNYSGNTYKSTETGYIKTLYIREGDKVGSNTKIADIYDDKSMKIKLPFLSGEAAEISVGTNAALTLTDTGEQLDGTVSSVSNMDVTLSGGRIIRYVTIDVVNPGGLTTDMAATAAIGEYICCAEGAFEATLETVMNADLSSNVEVGQMLIHEGDYVNKGTSIFSMESKSAEKLLRTYKDSMEKSEEALESAQNKVDSTQDNYDNYTITAPISGQVIKKNLKMGDKVSKSTTGSTTLAVIYDMSGYTFEMSVDELDVKEVAVGQNVEITADAVSGKTFSGTVTNISLQSNYANGVTNYPVTVTLSDGMDELLPGMNVDGVIILAQASDVLAVPVDALIRGNKVYVKDDTVTEAQGNIPAGFRETDVETGLISDEYVEITKGLSEGDVVYVAESTVSNSDTMMLAPAMGGDPGGGPGGASGGGHSGGSDGGGPRQ